MKNPLRLTGLLAGLALAGSASAATYYTGAGPFNITAGGAPNHGTAVVDTSTDTGDWITTNGYDAGTATGSLYFKVTINITNNVGETGGGNFFTGMQLFTGTTEHLAVGNNWLSTKWGGFGGVADYELTGAPSYTVGTPATFVLKVTQSTNTAVIYFNPDLGLTEEAQAVGSITTKTGLGANDAFDAIKIRAGNTTGATTFSNITIGTDSPFAAVPEPASLALAASALAIFGLRRRRN